MDNKMKVWPAWETLKIMIWHDTKTPSKKACAFK